MELDHTEIVIRQRTSLELFDLSLLTIKRHLRALSISGAILGLPLTVINVLLLQWMLSDDAILMAQVQAWPEVYVWMRYVIHLVALVVLEFPLVSLPITLFLGAQIFYMPVSFSSQMQNLKQVFLKSTWVLGVLRLGLVGIAIEILIRDTGGIEFLEGVLLFLLLPSAWLVRAFFPFAPEIIGLERCPLRSNDAGVVSYKSRRKNLHTMMHGELLARMILASFYGALWLVMLVGGCMFFQGSLLSDWSWNWIFSLIVLPLCLWFTGVFLAVFRYLSYIDTRIRLEGWEIELRMRAEASRLAKGETDFESAENDSTFQSQTENAETTASGASA